MEQVRAADWSPPRLGDRGALYGRAHKAARARRWPALNRWTLSAGLVVLLLSVPPLTVAVRALSPAGPVWQHLAQTVLALDFLAECPGVDPERIAALRARAARVRDDLFPGTD